MNWATAMLLLVACALLGALVGIAPVRVRTRSLVLGVIAVAFLVYMPGRCVTAIASTPYGTPEQLAGQTSCDTLYGAALPKLGGSQADGAGVLLGLVAAGISATALVIVRRRRWAAPPVEEGDARHGTPPGSHNLAP